VSNGDKSVYIRGSKREPRFKREKGRTKPNNTTVNNPQPNHKNEEHKHIQATSNNHAKKKERERIQMPERERETKKTAQYVRKWPQGKKKTKGERIRFDHWKSNLRHK